MVPAAYSPDTGLFYVPTNHVCMNYEPYKVGYTAGQPYVGATVSMFPPAGEHNMGNFIAWDAKTGKIVWSDKEQFSVWSGALATAGNVVFWNARRLSQSGGCQDGQGTLQVQDAVGHHRQCDNL